MSRALDTLRKVPTPLIGVWERLNIDVFLLWVVVLAVALLRVRDAQDAPVNGLEIPKFLYTASINLTYILKNGYPEVETDGRGGATGHPSWINHPPWNHVCTS